MQNKAFDRSSPRRLIFAAVGLAYSSWALFESNSLDSQSVNFSVFSVLGVLSFLLALVAWVGWVHTDKMAILVLSFALAMQLLFIEFGDKTFDSLLGIFWSLLLLAYLVYPVFVERFAALAMLRETVNSDSPFDARRDNLMSELGIHALAMMTFGIIGALIFYLIRG